MAQYRLVFAQSLSNFTCTCKLRIRRGGFTLFILSHRVKGQGQLWHSACETLFYSLCPITFKLHMYCTGKLLVLIGGTLYWFGSKLKFALKCLVKSIFRFGSGCSNFIPHWLQIRLLAWLLVLCKFAAMLITEMHMAAARYQTTNTMRKKMPWDKVIQYRFLQCYSSLVNVHVQLHM